MFRGSVRYGTQTKDAKSRTRYNDSYQEEQHQLCTLNMYQKQRAEEEEVSTEAAAEEFAQLLQEQQQQGESNELRPGVPQVRHAGWNRMLFFQLKAKSISYVNAPTCRP